LLSREVGYEVGFGPGSYNGSFFFNSFLDLFYRIQNLVAGPILFLCLPPKPWEV
jgi:hypothetical protein